MAASPTPTRRLLAAAGSNWLAFAAALGVQLALTPYLIRTLGKPRYDVWCVVEAVLAYFTLLDMGVAACLTRAVARAHATADVSGLSKMASSCLAVYLAAGAVAVAVGAPVLAGLAPRLAAKAADAPDVLPFMLLMLANLAAALPLTVFPAVLDGVEMYPAKSGVRVAFLGVRTAGLVWAAGRPGLVPLGLVYTVTALAEHAVLGWLCFRYVPGLRLSGRLVDRATLKEVRGYSGDAFLAMLAGRVTLQTGTILVGLLMPVGQATFLATAGRLVETAKALLRTVTATLTPGVSAMEARGDMAGVRALFLTVTRWVLYLVMPVNVGLWLFGRPFLHRWVGPEFVAGSFPAAAVLATTVTVGVAQSVASRVLYGLGRLRLFARLTLAEAGLNLALTAALIGPFGVAGVAAAVAVPNLLFCGAVVALTAGVLGVSAREYGSAWARPLALNAVPLAVWLGVGPVPPEWPAIVAGVAAGLVPYAAAVAVVELRPRVMFGRPARVPATVDR